MRGNPPVSEALGPQQRAGRRLSASAVLILVCVFLVSRAALLSTSSAANENWEEPVFLFSAVELQRLGVTHIWDFQDDLDHGGSVPLLLLGTIWLRAVEPSLVALKWMELAWWTVAFGLFLYVLARLFSCRAAFLGGILWIGASPNLARLQVTLVGSHPEGVLPALWATALLARVEPNSGRLQAIRCVLTAWLATVAAWMSYLLAGWSLAILAALLRGPARWRRLPAALLGVSAGLMPWIYQNVYRRPHGWQAWVERAFHAPPAAAAQSLGFWGMLRFLPDSWGDPRLGTWILGVLIGFAILLALAGEHAARGDSPMRSRNAVVALFTAAALSAAILVAGRITPVANEGYFFARFFVPLQVLLMALAAGGVEVATRAWGRAVFVVLATAATVLGSCQIAPLFGQGVTVREFRQDWLRGCLVFGVAELARAGGAQPACRRLAALTDAECRQRAFNGLGWSLADDYRRHGNLTLIAEALECAGEPALRRAICGGVRFTLARAPGIREPSPFPKEIERLCNQ
ncbi:MAG: hypothetical protein KatS3mg077_1918 [Candidatus Binatia bacterium]|nr:MAG: hypothetical protein KatS3mg077_1918 [Candidatus Binatia bacterium]